MKKRLLTAVFGVLLAVGMVSPALAATKPFDGACTQTGTNVGNSTVCKATGSDPLTGTNGTLNKVVTALAIVAGIVSVIFIIVGGIKYIFSGGDSAAVSSAKSTIIYALVGLVVAVVAREIIAFALSKV